MEENLLISREIMDCPLCDEVHELELWSLASHALIKSEPVSYREYVYKCNHYSAEDNSFVSGKFLDINLLAARDAYRIKHGLLASQEIIEIRQHYQLTQSELALLLGWGEVTVTRYETKLIQDSTYDQMLRMTRESPLFALQSLERNKSSFSDERYNRIRKHIESQLHIAGLSYFKELEILAQYIPHMTPDVYNGFTKLSIDKLSTILNLIATLVPNLFKVKLMKMLWYVDAYHYKRYNHSITGLVYKHYPYGACPIAYNEIIQLPSLNVIEELRYDESRFRITPSENYPVEDLEHDELETISLVTQYFKDFSARQIVHTMHEELAYQDTSEFELISFEHAMKLKELR